MGPTNTSISLHMLSHGRRECQKEGQPHKGVASGGGGLVTTLSQETSAMPPPGPPQPRYSVLRFLKPYIPRLTIVFGILGVGTFLGLLNPWFIQQLIDRVLLEARPDLLWIFAAAILGAALFRFSLGILQAWVYTAATSLVLLDMRRDFLEHLQRLPLKYFAGTRFGDIVARFNRDLSRIQEVSTGALLGFLTSAMTLVGTITWAIWYDAELFALAAIPFPFAVAVAWPFRSKIRSLTEHIRELASDLSSIVAETISGIRTVRQLGREKKEAAKFMSKSHQMIRKILSFQITNSFASGLPRLFVVTASVIVYTVGGKRVIQGEMELGALVAMGMYVGMIFAPLTSIVEYWLQLVQAKVSLDRVREVRELAPGTEDVEGAAVPDVVRGHLRFEDVNFRHEPERPLLEGVDLEILPSETVALVGKSGAGKSTLVDLLFRFLDPQAGTITIDGVDLRSLSMTAVRPRMAVVSQDEFLFHDTLRENICYGAAGATDADLDRAVQLSGIHTFLGELPQGLNTVLGERGLRLSAGQRQRVSIARAVLRDPAILVLDEATSALDLEADRALRAALRETARDATILVITHRLSTLGTVDRVFVLNEGRVTEEESVTELS